LTAIIYYLYHYLFNFKWFLIEIEVYPESSQLLWKIYLSFNFLNMNTMKSYENKVLVHIIQCMQNLTMLDKESFTLNQNRLF
jgi:hypothetical protein